MQMGIDYMPFKPEDCKYASKYYTDNGKEHYRCNYVINPNDVDRPLCNLDTGGPHDIPRCRAFP